MCELLSSVFPKIQFPVLGGISTVTEAAIISWFRGYQYTGRVSSDISNWIHHSNPRVSCPRMSIFNDPLLAQRVEEILVPVSSTSHLLFLHAGSTAILGASGFLRLFPLGKRRIRSSGWTLDRLSSVVKNIKIRGEKPGTWYTLQPKYEKEGFEKEPLISETSHSRHLRILQRIFRELSGVKVATKPSDEDALWHASKLPPVLKIEIEERTKEGFAQWYSRKGLHCHPYFTENLKNAL